jgi:hypothetical protein
MSNEVEPDLRGERDYWLGEAAQAEITIEDLQAQIELQTSRRKYCLQKLGMFAIRNS